MKKGDGNMKRIYFDVKELNADVYNIIVEYNKRPRVTGKREKGRWIYTATFWDKGSWLEIVEALYFLLHLKRKENCMSFLSKAINDLLEHQRKEEELCPKCINDNNGSYNPVCIYCNDFCNFKEKENKKWVKQ